MRLMISIVIPLYNKVNTIARALDTVLAQTYQDFEVVVVDDGSTDGGAAIVEQYADPRIRLIRQENAGVSAARNKGIAEARGEYVAFLDADDEWMPEFLAEIVTLQQEFPDCKAQATAYINHCNGVSTNIILNKIPFTGNHGIMTNYFDVASHSHPPVCSICVCIERALLQKIGGFPMGITSGEDLLTWARVAIQTHWAYSLNACAIYNMGEGYDKKNLPPRRQDVGDPVGKQLMELYSANPNVVGLRSYLSHWHKMRASTAIRYGERWNTLVEVGKSLKFNPLNYKSFLLGGLALLPKKLREYLIYRS